MPRGAYLVFLLAAFSAALPVDTVVPEVDLVAETNVVTTNNDKSVVNAIKKLKAYCQVRPFWRSPRSWGL